MVTGSSQIKHIFWDWNGTLLDDARLCASIINGILAKYDLPDITYEEYRLSFDFPVRCYYERLGLSGQNVSFKQTSVEFIEAYRRRWKVCSLQSKAKVVLRSIQRLEIPQSIITAGKETLLNGFVEHHGLQDFFVRLVGVDDIYASGKVECAMQYARSLNIKSNEILLVGDTIHDHEVASALGAASLLYTRGHHPPERLEPLGVPVISCLSEVLEYI